MPVESSPGLRNRLARMSDVLHRPTVRPRIETVVSGHPDRNVSRTTLDDGRVVYIKREHRVRWSVRWKNLLAGYGWSSHSQREARVLRDAAAADLPVPRVVAASDRLLMLEAVSGAVDLRAWLAEERNPNTRRELIRILGTTLARVHSAGFTHPDLSAKHVLVRGNGVVLLDWQRSRQLSTVTQRDRERTLAMLHVTIPDHLMNAHERLLLFRSYRELGGAVTVVGIRNAADRLRSHRSVRDQMSANPAPELVRLDGEAICVRAPHLKDLRASVWLDRLHDRDGPERMVLPFRDGRTVELLRCRTPWNHERRIEWWRGREWRSPMLREARILLHLERFDLPAPRLIAFGQKHEPRSIATSFRLCEAMCDVTRLDDRLRELRPDVLCCRVLMERLAQWLRRLHESGCTRMTGECTDLGVRDGDIVVLDPRSLRIIRRMDRRLIESDVLGIARWIAGRCGIGDALWFVLRYFGRTRLDSDTRRLARRLL